MLRPSRAGSAAVALAGLAVGAVLAPVPALAAPAHAAQLRAASLVGTWTGEVEVDEGDAEGYTAELAVRRNAKGQLRGKIAYGDGCTGVWRFKGKRMGAFTFKEVITADPLDEVTCSTPVAVRVTPTDEGIDVEWRVVKSGEVSTMSATPGLGRRSR